MRVIRKLTRLRDEWPGLLLALGIVWRVRIGLWCLSFKTLRERLARIQRRETIDLKAPEPRRMAWAVVVAARFVPGASCLTQALATDWLLKRAGYHGILHIGVALDEHGKLLAHAWLEYDGMILVGGRGHQQYTELPPVEIG